MLIAQGLAWGPGIRPPSVSRRCVSQHHTALAYQVATAFVYAGRGNSAAELHAASWHLGVEPEQPRQRMHQRRKILGTAKIRRESNLCTAVKVVR